MLKFTRSLFSASRSKSRRRRLIGQRWVGTTEALETRTLLAADLGAGDPDVSGGGSIEHHTALLSEGEGEIVALTLQFTDTSGNAITSVGANEDFQVRIFTEDLRSISEADAGVISAYMNMLFDTSLVSFVGPVAFSDDYDFLNNGGTVSSGQIEDINASANFVDFINGNSLGFGEKLFATVPFRSNAATSLSAVANDDTLAAFNGANSLDVLANDGLGGSALFLLDQSFAVGAEINLFSDSGGTQQADLDPSAGEVLYDQQTLSVVGSGDLTITSVGATSNGGTATIASDGQSIDYTPAAGFTGTETFSYTISSGGASSTATASVNVSEAAPDLVGFAQALSSAGVEFFGAIWCPACAQQKELFEDGADHLPFIEVTNPDRTLNQVGIDNNISSFPTWVFQDGTRREGILSLEELSTLSGIAIPTGTSPFLAEIADSTVLDGAPLHVALNGYDPNGGPLTYTVEVSNPSVVTATVLEGNRSMLIDMQGYEDMLFQLFDGRMQDVTDVIASLAQGGTYDDVIFHRVINNFVIQGGDPTGTGFGDPNLPNFDDKFNFDLQHVQTGLLSMAKSGDDTNSSQFFVTEGSSRHLDFNHSVFGLLVEGESARQGISDTAVNSSDQPLNTVRMNTVQIFEDTENGVMMLKAVDGATGTSDVTVTVTDGEGNTFQRTFTVTIQPDTQNGGPFLSDIPEDITTTVNTPVEIQLEGNDVEGDPVVFSAVPTGSVTGTTVDVNESTGVVTVTPPAGFVGTLQVLMRVEADPSVGDDTTDRFDTQVVDITVLDIPAPSGVDLLNTSDTGVSDTDNITSANTMEFEVAGVTSGNTVQLFRGSTLIGEGTAVSDTIVITADFDSGIADGDYEITATQIAGGLASSASTPLTITLDRTAPGDFTSMPPTDISSGTLLTYNIEHPEEGSLTYTLITQGVTGLAVDSQTGVLTWTPAANQEGPQTIVVTASDAAGNSLDHTINLTVNDPANPALTDEYSVDEDDTLNVSAAAGVLANDNGSNPTGLSATLVSDVSNGTLTLNADGSFSYTPTADFSGTDTFSYTYSDGNNTSNEALVVITVNDINDPPEAADDSYTVVEDGTLTIDAAAGVLANDLDQENGALSASVLQNPTNGTLTLNADGSFSYSPSADFSGTDSFTYTLTDDGGATDTGTVTITVTAVNDPPVAVDDSYTVSEDATLTVDVANGVLANDTDVENDNLNALIINNTSNGTVTLNGDGSFTYTPNANFFGTDTFTYRANDNTINSGNIATVTITVEAEADPPTAADDTATVFRGATAERIDVLANDTTDPDGTQDMTVTAVGTGSQGGTLTIIESGGAVAYTPAADFSGTETFTYTVTDTDGLTDTATITFTVEEFAPSTLSGFVYIDANSNGVFDSGEIPVGGVTITLAGTDSNNDPVSQTVTTGADGSYEFADLLPGDYTITQTQPLFLIDGQTTVGSQGGTADSNVITVTLAEDVTGTNNNFGEMGRASSTASMFDWFSSTPTDGIFSATDTANGQLWYYTESGWQGDPVLDFELEETLDNGMLSATYATEATQSATLSNGTERDYSIYATEGTSHFVRIHGSATELGLVSSASAGDTSGEGEAPSGNNGEGEGELPPANSNGLIGEGESGDFVFDVMPAGSLASEGEGEAESTADDDSGSPVDQAMLDLDSRTIAEQSSDAAVDAVVDAMNNDDTEDDDDIEELLAALSGE